MGDEEIAALLIEGFKTGRPEWTNQQAQEHLERALELMAAQGGGPRSGSATALRILRANPVA